MTLEAWLKEKEDNLKIKPISTLFELFELFESTNFLIKQGIPNKDNVDIDSAAFKLLCRAQESNQLLINKIQSFINQMMEKEEIL